MPRWASLPEKNRIDLTVVGPELPLTNGIVEHFQSLGLKIFGPTSQAAQIESSKSFAKNLMQKYKIPTASFETFTDIQSAKDYIRRQGAPLVVKADGLAAGKGVVVAMTEAEAIAAAEMMLLDKAFGEAGARIVIEEYLTGEEASLLAFTDGYEVSPLPAAQDHKRIFDGDEGPNTGGMGAYAGAPVVTGELRARIVAEILQPAVDAMRQEGFLYSGCLYVGLMITPDGPKVIEFNARFGDPETQVVLPLLASDLADVLEAVAEGRLGSVKDKISWHDEYAVCVVLASQGYPGEYRKGDIITGLKEAAAKGAVLFHAGTARSGGDIVTAGGRVLGVTAVAADIPSAVAKAYEAVGQISFPGVHFRKDIARRALK